MDIVRRIGRKFSVVVSSQSIAAAGGVFYAEDTKKFLLAKRATGKGLKEEGTWAGWGGRIETGESPEDAVRREAHEETGYGGRMTLQFVYRYENEKIRYDNYLVIVPKEFSPHLNWENSDYTWTTLAEIPSPIHPGFKDAVEHYRRAEDAL